MVKRCLLCAILLVGLIGCVKKPPSGVANQNVNTDISFGAKLPENTAAPANVVPPEQVPGEGNFGLGESAFRSKFTGPGSAPAAEPCPQAPVSAHAPEEASLNAQGVPPQGVYRWRYEGTLETAQFPGRPVAFRGFERRQLRDIQRVSDAEYRFTTLQPEFGSSDVIRVTWKVKTNAVQTRPPGVPDRREGEPDRGLAIVKIERLDGKTGGLKNDFNPAPPVLVLPLPAFQGERFDSSGVDRSSLEALSLSGFVPKREVVDACGKLVDGWKLESTRAFTSGDDPQSRVTLSGKWLAIFATQKGALPISEYIEIQGQEGTYKVTFTIGQTDPDPLP